MAPPYKLTVPRTKAELDDLLGWMVLSCPDFAESFLPGRDKEAVFEELQLGIDAVVKDASSRQAMHDLAKQMRSLCDAEQTKAAIETLDMMSDFLRKKSVH